MTMENRTPRERNLVESYMEVMRASDPEHIEDAHILEMLNRDLDEIGRKPASGYFLQRLYEWRSGTRPIPERVQQYMMRIVFRSVLERETSLDANQMTWAEEERVLEALTPPPRREPVPDPYKKERTRAALKKRKSNEGS